MKLIKSCFLLTMMSPGLLLAQDIQIEGSMDVPVALTTHNIRSAPAASLSMKHIRFMKLELSTKAEKSIDKRLHKTLQVTTDASTEPTLGKSVQLGMNNVPVLDQGPFGTCVTFATTAAIDAALNKGDYVSQLCSLQLGRYLENNAYAPSGWDGSWGSTVLNQFNVFGIVNKEKEHSIGCGGVTAYPMTRLEVPPGSDMAPEAYHSMSESLLSDDPEAVPVLWSSILDIYQTFIDGPNMNTVLNQVKSSLDQQDRLTFGVALPGVYLGLAGALGKHHQALDTWVITPEVILAYETDEDLAGHEMIITGYNDDAIAVDNHGISHKGLLTLRNSWGDGIGDKGNFYMSYSYFKALALEIQRIRTLH